MRGPYKDLIARKKSLSLCKRIYQITKTFPPYEKYGLADQLRRASVSVPSNIAEGSSRISNKHFIHYLRISLGSLYEIETQLEIAQQLGYTGTIDTILEQTKECGKLIGGLIKSLISKY